MKLLPVALALTLLSLSLRSEILLTPSTQIQFATIDQARHALTNRDDFIERLSTFDRSARLKTDQPVTEQQFLNFIATNILAFTPADTARVETELEKLKVLLKPFNFPGPKTILLIKTTGHEEGDAAYTRTNAIIIPTSKLLPGAREPIDDLICHELFHVLSRHNPGLKEKLYNAIGFTKCPELTFPPNLQRITNPDAPKNDHAINVQLPANPKNLTAIPILFARAKTYDPKRGGEFFNYLDFKLLVVETSPTATTPPKYDLANPTLLDPTQVTGFFEQVGRNTQYIIHPEEILADNFVHLINAKQSLPNPEILLKMKNALTQSLQK